MLRSLSSPSARLIVVSCIAIVLPSLGCRRAETTSVGTADDGNANHQSLDARRAEADGTLVIEPIDVPNGTPEELFTFIDDLDQHLDLSESTDLIDGHAELSADTRQAIALRRVMAARVAATDKILVRQVPDQTRWRAIAIQLDALRTLVALDPEGMTEQFDQYTERIVNGTDPLLARMAKATRFQSDVNRSLSGSGFSADELIDRLQSLLEDPQAGPETLNATRDAATWLLQSGDLSTATRAFRLIGQRFADDADATLASEGKSLVSQSINLELTQLARGVVEQQPEALEQLLVKLQELLAPDNDDANVLAYAMQTAQLLEFSGHPTEALKAYQLIGQRFQDDQDEALAARVKQSVSLAERRLKLIGQPIDIEGVLLSGDEFDWESYRGQWVLVCFWTTWHEGWPAEVDNILQAIRQRPHRDISVVAISLDDDRNLVERFLKERPSHWPVVLNSDPTLAGFENPNAIRFGVETVPFILLVNPQGIVVDIHLMGQRLAKRLEQRAKS